MKRLCTEMNHLFHKVDRARQQIQFAFGRYTAHGASKDSNDEGGEEEGAPSAESGSTESDNNKGAPRHDPHSDKKKDGVKAEPSKKAEPSEDHAAAQAAKTASFGTQCDALLDIAANLAKKLTDDTVKEEKQQEEKFKEQEKEAQEEVPERDSMSSSAHEAPTRKESCARPRSQSGGETPKKKQQRSSSHSHADPPPPPRQKARRSKRKLRRRTPQRAMEPGSHRFRHHPPWGLFWRPAAPGPCGIAPLDRFTPVHSSRARETQIGPCFRQFGVWGLPLVLKSNRMWGLPPIYFKGEVCNLNTNLLNKNTISRPTFFRT